MSATPSLKKIDHTRPIATRTTPALGLSRVHSQLTPTPITPTPAIPAHGIKRRPSQILQTPGLSRTPSDSISLGYNTGPISACSSFTGSTPITGSMPTAGVSTTGLGNTNLPLTVLFGVSLALLIAALVFGGVMLLQRPDANNKNGVNAASIFASANNTVYWPMTPRKNRLRANRVEVATLPPGLELVEATTGQSIGRSPVIVSMQQTAGQLLVRACKGDRYSPELHVDPRRQRVVFDLRHWSRGPRLKARPVTMNLHTSNIHTPRNNDRCKTRACRAAGARNISQEPQKKPKAGPANPSIDVLHKKKPAIDTVDDPEKPALITL